MLIGRNTQIQNVGEICYLQVIIPQELSLDLVKIADEELRLS